MNIDDISRDARYNDGVSSDTGLCWYALRTRSNYEKIASSLLGARGFEQFLPLYRSPKRVSGRTVDNSVPLFPGYLFCRFDGRYRSPILGTLGVASIVAFGGKPAQIDDVEIEAIRKALGSGQNIEPHPYLHEGQKIRVEKGPLRGLEGILVKKLNWRIVISVQLLLRAVAVEIDPDNIIPLDRHESRLPAGAEPVPGVCPGAQPVFERPAPLCAEVRGAALAGD
jgi:transcriptional antiterminator NusG